MYSVLLVAFAAAVSAAGEKPPDSLAIVAVDGCSQELTSGSARLLRAALAAQPGLTVKSEEETVAQLGGPLRGSLADAERLFAAARVDFQEQAASAGQVQRTLDEAMSILVSLPPSETHRWRAMRDVASFQAMVYNMERRPEAEQALERILRVDPAFEPDHELYSPDIWKLADKVRRRIKERTSATLSIASRPAGLPVAVDGRLIGKAPIALELPPGEYRVEGLFGKERSMARTVRVSGLTSVELDQSFEGAVRVSTGPCIATGSDREGRLVPLVKLARFLGVKQLVGIWQEEPAAGEVYVVAAVVDGATSQELREAKVKTSGGQLSEETLQKLALFISKGSAGPPIEPVVTKPRLTNLSGTNAGSLSTAARGSAGWSRRTWGTAVGGVGLAALGAAVVFDVMAHGAYEDARKAAASGDAATFESARSSSRSRGTTANILYVAGAVGVGAGAYLFFTGKEPSAAVSVAPVEGGAVAFVSGRLP